MHISVGSSNPWLYRTLSWMSPAWPIGAFAYSSGLEWAHEAGWLEDADAVTQWLAESLQCGSLFADALAFSRVWQVFHEPDAASKLSRLAELYLANQTCSERTLETTAQGQAFYRIALDANRSSYPEQVQRFEDALAQVKADTRPYPLVAATLFAAFDIPLADSTTAYLHAGVSNLVSAAQRIVPLGHTEAQQVLVRLEESVAHAARQANIAGKQALKDILHSNTLLADISAMRHETQYTRLFRT